MREPDYDGFLNEAEYMAYLAELEERRKAHESRSPEAIRQARCEKRRKRAERYWEVYLRTGTKVERWVEDLSESIIEQAREKMIRKHPALASFRGLV